MNVLLTLLVICFILWTILRIYILSYGNSRECNKDILEYLIQLDNILIGVNGGIGISYFVLSILG